jgi:hypothetical protein
MLHTEGSWKFSYFCKPNGKPIESVLDVADTVAGSAFHSDRAELFGVTLDDAHENPDGLATVVCYTGNGPNAHNNARAIAIMMTRGVELFQRLVNERDHGFVYSADLRDARDLLQYLKGADQQPKQEA